MVADSVIADSANGLAAAQLASLLAPEQVCTSADFELLHILGQGSHSTTRVVRRKADGHLLCCKHVPTERFPGSRAAEAVKEVELLLMLHGHPHIIGFVGAYVAESGLSIILEYAEQGTLARRLERRRELDEPLLESEVLDTYVQLTGALHHLHAHRVVHRDLKPSNVFFDRRNLARLGDFGIAAVVR